MSPGENEVLNTAPSVLELSGWVNLSALVRRAISERDKLQAFKDWVHAYLDLQGIPHHPPGTHGAAGCRIGDRMDHVFARIRELEKALAEGRS